MGQKNIESDSNASNKPRLDAPGQVPVDDSVRSAFQHEANQLRRTEVKVAANDQQLLTFENPFAHKTVEVPHEKPLPFSAGKPGALSNWDEQHAERVRKAHSSQPDTAFFGDSITDGMQLNNDFAGLHGKTANFGIHSDTTENLRYRLEHGEAEFKDGKAPKDIVMLIGTNDLTEPKSHAQIARDVMGDAEILAHKFPQSKVLVLGLLPRGGRREDVTDVNRYLQTEMSRPHSANIRFADIGKSMLEKDGSMSRDIWQPDFTHPTYGHGNSRLLAAIKRELETNK